LMSIHNVRIPVPPILNIFKKADSKSMKRVENRAVVIGPILVDDDAARLQCSPERVSIGVRRGPNKGHHGQIPLLRAEGELIIASDDSLEGNANPLGVFPGYSNRLVRGINPVTVHLCVARKTAFLP
jgi:hypothetical protein